MVLASLQPGCLLCFAVVLFFCLFVVRPFTVSAVFVFAGIVVVAVVVFRFVFILGDDVGVVCCCLVYFVDVGVVVVSVFLFSPFFCYSKVYHNIPATAALAHRQRKTDDEPNDADEAGNSDVFFFLRFCYVLSAAYCTLRTTSDDITRAGDGGGGWQRTLRRLPGVQAVHGDGGGGGVGCR